MEYSRQSISSRLSIRLLVIAIVIIVATIFITQYRNLKNRESVNWVTHTHEVIETSHYYLSSIQSARATYNVLLFSHDPVDRGTYYSTVSHIDSLIKRMRLLTLDNPQQTALLDSQIIPLNQKLLQNWNSELELQKSQREHEHSVDKEQKEIADKIVLSANIFIHNEELLLSARNNTVKTNFLINDVLRFIFLVTVGLACVSAFFTIRKQQRMNLALFDSLQEANFDLEEKVKNRTEELSVRNNDLNESLEEIKLLQQSLDQRNQKLEESLAEVQFLYDHAPCGYHTIDPNGMIIKMNKTELTWLGYTEEEVIGKKGVADLLTATSVEDRRLQIEQLKKVGQLDNLEFECVRKDGSTFFVLLNTIAYFDSNGKYIKNRSSMFDITQRKLLEKKLAEANEYLIKYNEEKDRFIGIATHDLKSPLHGILGLTHLLRMSDDQGTQLDYIGMIESSALKMNDLIVRLLDLNRIANADAQIKIETVNLALFLNRINQSFNETAKKKSIELILENQTTGVEISTDVSILEQIIDNLISNAIKFSPFHKKVWIRVKRSETNNFIFEIEDQGPGISAEEIPKLFRSFQRLSAKPTGNESSTGLGLSIVKEMAQKINANISVTSDEGKGSIFRVVLA